MSDNQSLVSIDFWNTLVIAETGGKARRKIRHEAICEVANDYVKDLPNAQIESATQEASKEFHRIWLNEHRTPSSKELINRILNNLGIPASKYELKYLIDRFENSLLESPPELVTGAREAIETLASEYNLALISDTMYSPGDVIRRFLASHNLLQSFNNCVFSNETGYSKPNPKAFTQILDATRCIADRSFHIGDRIDTDIKGAKNAGMKSILFVGSSGEKKHSTDRLQPDFVCKSWEEVTSVL